MPSQNSHFNAIVAMAADEVAMNEILESIEGIRGRRDILGSRKGQPDPVALTCPHISGKMAFEGWTGTHGGTAMLQQCALWQFGRPCNLPS